MSYFRRLGFLCSRDRLRGLFCGLGLTWGIVLRKVLLRFVELLGFGIRNSKCFLGHRMLCEFLCLGFEGALELFLSLDLGLFFLRLSSL